MLRSLARLGLVTDPRVTPTDDTRTKRHLEMFRRCAAAGAMITGVDSQLRWKNRQPVAGGGHQKAQHARRHGSRSSHPRAFYVGFVVIVVAEVGGGVVCLNVQEGEPQASEAARLYVP